ncbi:MAG: YdcF family protein, partial [Alphaproteobacteria bacterium]|nr:YdcF family protein [Alphaproteobacteria bacterium]
NTQQNGAEVVAWAKKNNFTSIIVVTSHYHIPRSLREIHHLDHNLVIIPCPVSLPGGSKSQVVYYLFSDFIKYTLLKWGFSYPDTPSRF